MRYRNRRGAARFDTVKKWLLNAESSIYNDLQRKKVYRRKQARSYRGDDQDGVGSIHHNAVAACRMHESPRLFTERQMTLLIATAFSIAAASPQGDATLPSLTVPCASFRRRQQ